MDDREFRQSLHIEVSVLDVWIEQGWLVPDATEGGRAFREADVARGRLILDLIETMGLNEAGVDVVMELVDQVHGLRGTLRDLVDGIRRKATRCNSASSPRSSSGEIFTTAELRPVNLRRLTASSGKPFRLALGQSRCRRCEGCPGVPRSGPFATTSSQAAAFTRQAEHANGRAGIAQESPRWLPPSPPRD